jgi:hypothetical protein
LFLQVPCSALGSPSGGHVTIQTDGSTTTAVYECYTNYTLNGSSQLTCRSDGSWDFLESTCGETFVLLVTNRRKSVIIC